MIKFHYPLNIGLICDWTAGGLSLSEKQLGLAIDQLLAPYLDSVLELQINFLVAICSELDVATALFVSCKYPEAILHLILPVQQDCMDEILPAEVLPDLHAVIQKAKHISPGDNVRSGNLGSDKWPLILARARHDSGRLLINHCDSVIFGNVSAKSGKSGFNELIDMAKDKKCPGALLEGHDDHQVLSGKTMAPRFMAAMKNLQRLIKSGSVDQHYLLDELEDSLGNGVPTSTVEALKQNVLPVFTATEGRAAGFQNMYNRAGVWAFACSFLAAALVAIAVTFFHAAPLFFVLEFILLMTGLGLIFRAETKKSRRNWQSLRHLAEQLRSFFYLAMVGVQHPKAYASRRVDQGLESGWAGMVISQVADATPLPLWPDSKIDSLTAFIKEKWLDGQVNYHKGKLKDTTEKAERLERASKLLFVLATLFAFGHAVAPMAWQAFHDHLVAHWLTLFALILPVAGGVLGATLSHRDYKRIALHSEKMIYDLERFREGFAPLTMEELDKDALELADVMLGESEQWVDHIAARSLHPEP